MLADVENPHHRRIDDKEIQKYEYSKCEWVSFRDPNAQLEGGTGSQDREIDKKNTHMENTNEKIPRTQSLNRTIACGCVCNNVPALESTRAVYRCLLYQNRARSEIAAAAVTPFARPLSAGEPVAPAVPPAAFVGLLAPPAGFTT